MQYLLKLVVIHWKFQRKENYQLPTNRGHILMPTLESYILLQLIPSSTVTPFSLT